MLRHGRAWKKQSSIIIAHKHVQRFVCKRLGLKITAAAAIIKAGQARLPFCYDGIPLINLKEAMKLYYSPGACSMAPHIVAREAGIPLDMVKVDIPNKKTEDGGDFWQVNAKGYVPALQLDDGSVMTEVSVICQYLADQAPQSGLVPPFGGMARYEQMAALNFASAEVHKQLGALFNPKMTPEMREVQLGSIGRRLDTLEQLLAGKSYISGDNFTAADAYLFTVLNWTRPLKVDLSKWSNIQAFMARVAERPKVQETLKAEGLVK
jgi:glutathione S-transferase